jgi:glycosyltransferase involved in cell wall biosynthesis
VKRIHLLQGHNNGSAHYREALPARHVNAPDVQLYHSPAPQAPYDAYWLPHAALAAGNLTALMRLLELRTPFVVSLDDNVWELPTWNPATRSYTPEAIAGINWAIRSASRVVTSTSSLAVAVAQHTGVSPSKIAVLPSLVDLDEWPELPPRQHDAVRILFAGSDSHEGDWDEATNPGGPLDAVERIARERPDVEVLFVGYWPADFAQTIRIKHTHLTREVPADLYRGRVAFVDPVPLEDYPRTLAILRPDIAVAPLAAHPFNQSRSNTKWMEYSMAGAATLASDSTPYACLRNEVDGLLVQSGEWYDALNTLIDDEALRRKLADEARCRVRDCYSWQHSPHRWLWQDFFGGLS